MKQPNVKNKKILKFKKGKQSTAMYGGGKQGNPIGGISQGITAISAASRDENVAKVGQIANNILGLGSTIGDSMVAKKGKKGFSSMPSLGKTMKAKCGMRGMKKK